MLADWKGLLVKRGVGFCPYRLDAAPLCKTVIFRNFQSQRSPFPGR